MSGIVGLLYRDGRPAQRDHLATAMAAMGHRGPEGCGVWAGGPVVLGHQMLWTTPESRREMLPRSSDDGALAITADVRIDNRDELLSLLRLDGRPPSTVPDSELILCAYRRWGEACVDRLLGAFAFAVWDGGRQRLFCARDHLGTRPFYMYSSENMFCFASDIPPMLNLPGVPRRLNELRVLYQLVPELGFGDKTITYYQDIERLAPGHCATVSTEGVVERQYWTLDLHREVRLSSDEEYAEAFRDLFLEAVSCRLRSAYPVGSTLSGGLDSSSIVCAGRDRLGKQGDGRQLHTFSAVFTEAVSADESSFIRAVVDQGGVIPHYTHPDRESPLIDLEWMFDLLGEGFWGPNYAIALGVFQSAQQCGVRIVLDGSDGDTTVSHGFDYLLKLVRSGQWQTFAGEAAAITERFADRRYATRKGIFRSFGLPYLAGLARKGRWGAFARGVNQAGPLFGLSRRSLLLEAGVIPLAPPFARNVLQRSRNNHRASSKVPEYGLVDPEFAERMDLHERRAAADQRWDRLPETERTSHFRELDSGALPYSLELANRMAAGHAVEVAFPFCDKRLVEFCLALPPEQKLRDGWSRFVMRNAMEGLLPPEVQWRGGKGALSPMCNRGLALFERERLDQVILDDGHALEGYVDREALRASYERYLDKQRSKDLVQVWCGATSALWLDSVDWSEVQV